MVSQDIPVDAKTRSVVNQLATETGSGKAETIQKAVALLKYLAEEEQKGSHIVVVESDGTRREIVISGFGRGAE